jgi:outer membrane protein insertion porin family
MSGAVAGLMVSPDFPVRYSSSTTKKKPTRTRQSSWVHVLHFIACVLAAVGLPGTVWAQPAPANPSAPVKPVTPVKPAPLVAAQPAAAGKPTLPVAPKPPVVKPDPGKAVAQPARPATAPPGAAAPPAAPTAPSASADPNGAPSSSAPSSSAPPSSALAPAAGTAQPTPVPTETPEVRLPRTEAERAAGLPIVRIDVSGNRRVSVEDVKSYLRLKVGEAFKPETLTIDVRVLWESGFFDDIEVDLSQGAGGVTLRYLVRERPNVKDIEFAGNEELDNEKLLEAVEFKVNTSLSIPAVERSAKKIKDAYAEKGYFLANVTYELDTLRENEVTVRFKVTENQAVTVRRVTFVGNYSVPDGELREVMATAQTSILSFGSGGPYKQDVLERDVLVLSALYYDKGFLTVQIGTPRVMLTPDRSGIEITLNITEGPRFKIRKFYVYERDADGNEIEPIGGRKALRQMLKGKGGDFFNRAELIKDLTAVRTLYRDAGYANVETEPDTELDPQKHEVDITIPIRRNARVKVARIEFKGNTKTRDKVLRRELEIEEGDYFSETKLEDSKRRLMALGYFERVDMSTEQVNDPASGSTPGATTASGKAGDPKSAKAAAETINVIFDVAERPTGTFQVGAGFSSIESFIVTAQVQQANLFGTGQSLALQAQLSGLRQLVNIRLFEPYLFDSDWSSSIELFNQLFQYSEFSRRTIGGSLTLGYALIQPWLRISLTGTAQYDAAENAQVSSFLGQPAGFFTAFSQAPLSNLFNNGRTFSLRPAITYDTRDNRLFPTSGFFLQASTELATGLIGSQIEFLRHTLNARVYFPLGGQTPQPGSGFVLKANANFGMITSPNPEGLPIFIRYFLGGILDVRGYRLRTIGARLPLNQTLDLNAQPYPNGFVIGGNMQAYTNVEFEFPVLDKVGIRGVAFFDAGNTWNLEKQYCRTTPAPQFPAAVSPCFNGAESLINLRTAVGAGVRWFSPLGPLRFEWGFPLKRFGYEESYVFEFTIGNFF